MEKDFVVVGKQSPLPIGSMEDVRAAGMSLREFGTCAQPDKNIRGCALWGKCRFDQRRMGGFKGDRPHYVGYRLITDRAEGNAAKEDFCSCMAFTEVLLDRLDTGNDLVTKGKDGERIAIVAQEGESIVRRFQVGVNSKGEVIKPQPDLVKALEKAGYKVNVDDQSQPITYKTVVLEVIVPEFPPVRMTTQTVTGDYSTLIAQREMARLKEMEDADDRVWEQAMSRQRIKPEDEPARVTTPDPVDSNDLAALVGKKKT